MKKKLKFFAMIAQLTIKIGNFRFAPELRETNQMAVGYTIPKRIPQRIVFLNM
ncbi:hypothetical protein ACWATR_24680 [Nostoc sp. UIC 10890]